MSRAVPQTGTSHLRRCWVDHLHITSGAPVVPVVTILLTQRGTGAALTRGLGQRRTHDFKGVING